MKSNNAEVHNILKKNIRGSTAFKCILLQLFLRNIVIFITQAYHNNRIRPHGK